MRFGHGGFDHPKQFIAALTRRRGAGEDLGQFLEPAGDAIRERLDVGLHLGGGYFIGLGENEDEGNRVGGEPFHKLQINLLRWKAGVNEREDAAEVRALLQVIGHRLVELGSVLARHLRKTVSRQIHQSPGLVHREDVDELGEPGDGGDPRQPLLVNQLLQLSLMVIVRFGICKC